MGGKAGKHGIRTVRKKQKEKARVKAGWMRPMLEREDGWDLATGLRRTASKDDIAAKRRCVTRLTKKAVLLMLPECSCSVRQGRSYDRHWVHVEVALKSGRMTDSETRTAPSAKEVERNIKDILVALGISYVLNPTGNGKQVPCLSVRVSDGSE